MPDAPVTIHLRNVSFVDALRTALDLDDPGRLAYRVRDGVIIVTGDYNPSFRDLETRVYDVRDLIAKRVRWVRQQSSVPEHSTRQRPILEPECHAAILRITETLEQEIDALHYTEEIEELAGRLIITAQPESHAQIAEVLNALRKELESGP